MTLGTSEVVSWKSSDGAVIEGVLRKPAGFRPGTPAPLLVIIHGGPTGVSRPTLFGATYVQGGYISAFLTTHDSARFRAVSVGAGISNWVTYYVSTDIHPFTRQYLKATPWDDPEVYRKTSPMTYIKGGSAPTLIQHGDADLRVPVSNALELYQGLRDQGVTSAWPCIEASATASTNPRRCATPSRRTSTGSTRTCSEPRMETSRGE